jgi:hypothetical protein
MPQTVDKASLSPARRALLELFQRFNFGTLYALPVRGGEPVLDPPPRLVRQVKHAAENGPRPELHAPAFRLKQQWVELFALLDAIGDGVVESIEFKNGIPFMTLVEARA